MMRAPHDARVRDVRKTRGTSSRRGDRLSTETSGGRKKTTRAPARSDLILLPDGRVLDKRLFLPFLKDYRRFIYAIVICYHQRAYWKSFWRASSFNQPLNTSGNKWNVSNVTNMESMFYDATSFNQPLHAPWYVVEQSESE